MKTKTTKTKILSLFICIGFLCSCSNDDNASGVAAISELKLENLNFLSSNIPKDFYTDLTFTNSNTGYAISRLGKIIKTIDGGVSWTTYTVPGNIYLKKIQFVSTDIGYIIGGDTTGSFLYKTINAGQTWTTIDLHNAEGGFPTGMYFKNKNEGYITSNKLFIKTTNGGQNWSNVLAESSDDFTDVSFKDNNIGIVTTNTGSYYRTTNGGGSWQAVDLNHEFIFSDIYFIADKSLLKNGNSLFDSSASLTIPLPNPVSKLQYLDAKKCIGIGQHYEAGFFPYGDILLTNDNWSNFSQKTYQPLSEAMDFTALARMNNHKTMILGTGQVETKIVLLTY